MDRSKWRDDQVEQLVDLGIPNLQACQAIDLAMKAWEDMNATRDKTIGLLEDRGAQVLAKAILGALIIPAWCKAVAERDLFLETVVALAVRAGNANKVAEALLDFPGEKANG